jgi:hypothetical protein
MSFAGLSLGMSVVGQRIVDPNENLLYFSWFGYLCVVLVYSALTFHGEFSKIDGPLIFSKQNSRSILGISLIHGVFLLAILGALRAVPLVLPLLPEWMTDTFVSHGTHSSIADYLCMIAAIVMYRIERKCLYAESETI